MPEITEYTITDRDELEAEFETIRKQGYATNEEEHTKSPRAIATPVTNSDSEVIGAISIADATYRMKGDRSEEKLPELLLEAINEVELDIVYS